MTIQEAGKNYDVSMNYWYDEEADLWGWAWTLNCGYQCWVANIHIKTLPNVRET